MIIIIVDELLIIDLDYLIYVYALCHEEDKVLGSSLYEHMNGL